MGLDGGSVVGGMQDTIDLIPIGAFYGKGARAGKFGAFLMACFNTEEGTFEAACKVGTGFSKEDLKTLTENFQEKKVESKPSCYVMHPSKRLQPDVWLLPNEVWEIGADCITRSPSYLMCSS
jgi:DNA ligase-1